MYLSEMYLYCNTGKKNNQSVRQTRFNPKNLFVVLDLLLTSYKNKYDGAYLFACIFGLYQILINYFLTQIPVKLDLQGCSPSPCDNDCRCIESCKHSDGYFCKPSEEKPFLGRNCSHPPPYVECRNDSVMRIKVSKSLMSEYSQNIANGIFYMDASAPANQPPAVFDVDKSCQLSAIVDTGYYGILMNLSACGTTQLFTGRTVVYMNRIWWDRLTGNNQMSFTRPVAEVVCTYPTLYHVQSGVRPFCCDPVPRKTDRGTFLLRSALHKNPPGSARIPVRPDQRGTATYTVGEMMYLTVTLDLGPRMTFYSDEETLPLLPRFTKCWFSPEVQSSGPEDQSLVIYPNEQPAFNVWGPVGDSNVVDIGFEVVRWKDQGRKLLYIHCLLEVYSDTRHKRSLHDEIEYNGETVIKGPIRIVTKTGKIERNKADLPSDRRQILSSAAVPLLIVFIVLMLIFTKAVFTVGRMGFCRCSDDDDEEEGGRADVLDFNMDGRY